MAAGRRAAPVCAHRRRLVARAAARGRWARVILDNLSSPTPQGSRLVRNLLADLGDHRILVSTPAYDPDAKRSAWRWRALRLAVTHNHHRLLRADLVGAATGWARDLTPAPVRTQIGSPFAPRATLEKALDHAA